VHVTATVVLANMQMQYGDAWRAECRQTGLGVYHNAHRTLIQTTTIIQENTEARCLDFVGRIGQSAALYRPLGNVRYALCAAPQGLVKQSDSNAE
jgi:hypothetical protein